MKNASFKTGFGFGIGSGIITTLGLMIGLFSTTNSKGIVIAGILTIAIADSCSDALGIHVSQESLGNHTNKEIWFSTLYTFLSKFFVTLTFLPIIIIFNLTLGIILNIFWGFILLFLFSYVVAKKQGNNPYKAAMEHIAIMFFVITATYYLGKLIDRIFIS
ncbi:MAG: hypothetical protein WCT85_01315 [Parachlamydiales bacterium]|jgi:VIT1/CCC1 family predicted Fe2+/Mn2+ transporter